MLGERPGWGFRRGASDRVGEETARCLRGLRTRAVRSAPEEPPSRPSARPGCGPSSTAVVTQLALACPRPKAHLMTSFPVHPTHSLPQQGPAATTTHGEVMRVTHQATGTDVPVPPELSALLAAANDADRERAWAGFVDAFSAAILRVARSLGGDHDLVMDRYAFVLGRLRADDCRRLRAYVRPGAGTFSLWLIVVVRRLCLDHHRERYGRAREGAGGEQASDRARRRCLADLVADRADPELLAAPAAGAPDQILAHEERARALVAALERLDPEDRLLLRFRFGEDLTAREIAGVMHLPTVFHVYRRLDRVLKQLRASLHERGVREVEP
jgi:RNA polymerase sigma factor (sigma-70 family)